MSLLAILRKTQKPIRNEPKKGIWHWKQSDKSLSQIPTKKRKLSSTCTKKGEQQKYLCLECFEAALQRKSDEKYSQICRWDTTSVKRHKFRWHLPPKSESCTFVSSNSSEVQMLRQKYDKASPALLIPEHPKSRASPEHPISRTNPELIQTSVTEIRSDAKDMPEQLNLLEKDDISALKVDLYIHLHCLQN